MASNGVRLFPKINLEPFALDRVAQSQFAAQLSSDWYQIHQLSVMWAMACVPDDRPLPVLGDELKITEIELEARITTPLSSLGFSRQRLIVLRRILSAFAVCLRRSNRHLWDYIREYCRLMNGLALRKPTLSIPWNNPKGVRYLCHFWTDQAMVLVECMSAISYDQLPDDIPALLKSVPINVKGDMAFCRYRSHPRSRFFHYCDLSPQPSQYQGDWLFATNHKLAFKLGQIRAPGRLNTHLFLAHRRLSDAEQAAMNAEVRESLGDIRLEAHFQKGDEILRSGDLIRFVSHTFRRPERPGDPPPLQWKPDQSNERQ